MKFTNRLRPLYFTSDDELQVMGRAHNDSVGSTIRCLVWNIYKARRSNWPSDFATLIADRDLVMLQEAVFNAPTDATFTQCDRFEWVMARSFKDPSSGIEHGVKTGCVSRSVERHFYMSPHVEPILQTQKLLLTTLYALAGGAETLLVLNMHAINFVSEKKYADQLDQLVAALASHTGPVILGGDFNTWSVGRLNRFQSVATSAGLREAVMERQGKLMHLNQHLDHVFYRGLRLLSVESHGHYQSSDHAPITATFEHVPEG